MARYTVLIDGKSGAYGQPKPVGYEDALLAIVEHGRDQAGRIGEQ